MAVTQGEKYSSGERRGGKKGMKEKKIHTQQVSSLPALSDLRV